MSGIAKQIGSCLATAVFFLGVPTLPVGAESGEPGAEQATTESGDRSLETGSGATRDTREMMHVIRGRGGATPGLDALLKLPTGYVGERTPSVAGASQSEWRRRFRTTRESLAEARANLEKSKRELDGVAQHSGGTQWSVAPPGAGGGVSGGGGAGGPSQSTSPLSFKLRGVLKRSRLDLDRAEKDMRELNIEAGLAGVPDSWRGDADAERNAPSEVGQLLD